MQPDRNRARSGDGAGAPGEGADHPSVRALFDTINVSYRFLQTLNEQFLLSQSELTRHFVPLPSCLPLFDLQTLNEQSLLSQSDPTRQLMPLPSCLPPLFDLQTLNEQFLLLQSEVTRHDAPFGRSLPASAF